MLQSQPIAAPIVMVCHEIQNAVEEERNAYERGVRLQMVWDNLSCLGTEALARWVRV